jgi:hypothetical protein
LVSKLVSEVAKDVKNGKTWPTIVIVILTWILAAAVQFGAIQAQLASLSNGAVQQRQYDEFRQNVLSRLDSVDQQLRELRSIILEERRR